MLAKANGPREVVQALQVAAEARLSNIVFFPRGHLFLNSPEVPDGKWYELRYGLFGQLEDTMGEASQA
jgi:hypothetical protein